MQSTADVVIVGGGLMGLSAAYHLARKGYGKVVVLEKEETLVSQSSGRSAGGVRLQFSSAVNVQLSQYSLERLKRFEQEMGVPCDLRQVGYLFLLSSEADLRSFQEQVALQRSLGVPTQVLSPQEVKEIAPFAVTDDLVGATFCPEDGYADPFSVARGYELRARELGVQILTGTAVTRVLSAAGRVTGVATSQGEIHAPVVLNAAGAWAGELGRAAGVEVPVKPYRRQIYITDLFPQLPDDMPFTIDFATTAYCRKEGSRILMGMSDQAEPSSFQIHTDDRFLLSLIEAISGRIPVLAEAGIYRGWGGLYEVTPDHNGIIDEHPNLKGFFIAAGFSGHGFQQSPAVGRVVSELIADGKPFIDVSPLGIGRFARGGAANERAVV